MTTSHEKNIATLIHLSSLSQYIVPFGNFIFPIIIWSIKKDNSKFVDFNGKQVLNFQLSIFLYSLILLLIAIPVFLFIILKNVPFEAIFHNHSFDYNFDFDNFSGIAIVGILAVVFFSMLKLLEIALVIYASVKTSDGVEYKYPLSIPFFK